MKDPTEDPTIYEVIRAEHDEVSELLGELADEEDPARREALFEEVLYHLERHAQAEEAVFYEVLAQHEDTRALARAAVKEHTEVRRLLSELDMMETDDARWDETVAALTRAVRQHVASEENTLFPAVQKLLDDDQARTLAETFEAMELRVEDEDEDEDEDEGKKEPGAAA